MKTIDTLIAELNQRNIQLWLEGDRLRYRATPGTLTPDLKCELKQRKPEILSFLQEVNASQCSAKAPIKQINREGELPLSLTQEGTWLQHQFEPDSPIHNIPYVFRLQGRLNIPVLEQSQNEIIRRHEILRTTFPVVDGQPVLKIAPELKLPITVIDLEKIPANQQEEQAQEAVLRACREVANQQSCLSFDLALGPLVRLTLLRLDEQDHILILNFHRIICDGNSTGIFFGELVTLYEAFVQNHPSPLADLSLQYLDFAAWQRQTLDAERLKTQIDCWQEYLGENLPLLQLPTDYPRPSIPTFKGSRLYRLLPTDLSLALNRLSQETGCTLFMTLITGFQILLGAYAQQDDVLVSFSHAGRTQAELEEMIGSFTKTLALRTHLSPQASFRDILTQVRESILWTNDHYDVPFHKLIQAFQSPESRERSPLLQVLFALNPPWKGNQSLSAIHLDELSIRSLFGYVYIGQTKFDLTLVMRETDQGLRVVFEYNTDLFAESRIEQMLKDLQNVLENIAAKPDQSIEDLTQQIIVEKRSLNSYTEHLSDKLVLEKNDNLLTQTNLETSVAARNEIEAKLIKIWENLLNIRPISVTDNFFAIGGSSLLAVKLFTEISQLFGRNYPLSILLKAPTIEELAVKLQKIENFDDEWSPLVEIQPQGSKPPLFCIHGGGFNILIYRNLAIGLGEDYPVYGLQARGLEGNTPLVERLEEMATDYIQEIQKIQPQGPYFLCGLSNGGNIALEMAQQLQAKGQNVAFLGLFDTYAPNSAGLLPPGQRLLSSIKYVLQYRVPYLVKNGGSIDVLAEFEKIWKKLRKSRTYSGTSSNFNASKSNFKTTEKQALFTETNRLEYWMNQISLYILDHSPWSFYAPSRQLKNEESEIANTLKSLENNYRKVYKKYEPQPYSGQITLFRSKETPPGYYRDSHLGWKKIAQNRVEVHVIPGHHTSIMKSPILFEKMKTCLEQVASAFNEN